MCKTIDLLSFDEQQLSLVDPVCIGALTLQLMLVQIASCLHVSKILLYELYSPNSLNNFNRLTRAFPLNASISEQNVLFAYCHTKRTGTLAASPWPRLVCPQSAYSTRVRARARAAAAPPAPSAPPPR
jgi:hypothetical protein